MDTPDQIARRIFNQATVGTKNNPGFTPVMASLLVAQARHETGNFSSNAFRRHNNAFGYTFYPGSPYQLPAGGLIADNGRPVAAYQNVEDSTKEVIDWIYRRFREGRFPNPDNISDPGKYAEALKKAGYYGDTLANYSRGLMAHFALMAPALTLVPVLVAAFFFWWVNKR